MDILKAEREAIRRSVTKLATKIGEEIMLNKDVKEIEEWHYLLMCKAERLDKSDHEIRRLVKTRDVEDEMEVVWGYRNMIDLWEFRLSKKITELNYVNEDMEVNREGEDVLDYEEVHEYTEESEKEKSTQIYGKIEESEEEESTPGIYTDDEGVEINSKLKTSDHEEGPYGVTDDGKDNFEESSIFLTNSSNSDFSNLSSDVREMETEVAEASDDAGDKRKMKVTKVTESVEEEETLKVEEAVEETQVESDSRVEQLEKENGSKEITETKDKEEESKWKEEVSEEKEAENETEAKDDLKKNEREDDTEKDDDRLEETPIKKRGEQPKKVKAKANPASRRGKVAASKCAEGYGFEEKMYLGSGSENEKHKEKGQKVYKKAPEKLLRCGGSRREPIRYANDDDSEVEKDQPSEKEDYKPEVKNDPDMLLDYQMNRLWCFKGGTVSGDLDDGDDNDWEDADGQYG